MAEEEAPSPVTMFDAVRVVLSVSRSVREVEIVALGDGLGRVVAEDVVAPFDHPPFDASLSDGYAVNSTSSGSARLASFPTVLAGQRPRDALSEGECCYVATGAPTPEGTRFVVKREVVEKKNDEIRYLNVRAGSDIRRRGSDHLKGEVLVEEGVELRPWDLGLIATCGQTKVSVRKKPTVCVISTGDELCLDSDAYDPRCMVYDANRASLLGLCKEAGANTSDGGVVRDDEAELTDKIRDAIVKHDIVVVSGGGSEGRADFGTLSIKQAMVSVSKNAKIHFSKLHMKPGKPTTFGSCPLSLVFGLPGNPVSAIVTCQLLVVPAIRKLAGYDDKNCLPRQVNCRLDADTVLDAGRPEYQRVTLSWQQEESSSSPYGVVDAEQGHYEATTLGLQRSSRLASFRGATALACLPESALASQCLKNGGTLNGKLPKGTDVTALLLGHIPRPRHSFFNIEEAPILLHLAHPVSRELAAAIEHNLRPCTLRIFKIDSDEAIILPTTTTKEPAIALFLGSVLATDTSSLDLQLAKICPRLAPGLAFAMSRAIDDPLQQPFAALQGNLLVIALPPDAALKCLTAIRPAIRPILKSLAAS